MGRSWKKTPEGVYFVTIRKSADMLYVIGAKMMKKKGEGRIYGRNLKPAPRLAELVSYWTITSRHRTVRRDLIFAPDEHIEIIFDFHAGAAKRTAMILGIQRKPRNLKTKRALDIIGIKFKPGGFYSLFRVPATACFDKLIPVSSVLRGESERFNEVFRMKTLAARIRCLNSILERSEKTKEPLPPGLKLALENIHARNGNITVREMAAGAGWSRRWFLAAFKKWVGVPPQVLCGNFKFVTAIRSLDTGDKPVSAAQNAGYSDQAHLNRSFKNRLGLTPTKTFKFRKYKKPLPLS